MESFVATHGKNVEEDGKGSEVGLEGPQHLDGGWRRPRRRQ